MLQLQSPNKNHINGTQISGNLICTFSNPFIGVVKSDISLFKSLSAQPDVTRDMMLKQYWNMDNFHEEWQTRVWKNTHFRIEKDFVFNQKTHEETYGNFRLGDHDRDQMIFLNLFSNLFSIRFFLEIDWWNIFDEIRFFY